MVLIFILFAVQLNEHLQKKEQGNEWLHEEDGVTGLTRYRESARQATEVRKESMMIQKEEDGSKNHIIRSVSRFGRDDQSKFNWPVEYGFYLKNFKLIHNRNHLRC